MCFLTHNGTKSNHYFILSLCGKARLCYGDNNDNGFLLYLHHAYDLADGCVLPKCVYISRMCDSKQCSLETKIQGMCDTFFSGFLCLPLKWLPFNYRQAFYNSEFSHMIMLYCKHLQHSELALAIDDKKKRKTN